MSEQVYAEVETRVRRIIDRNSQPAAGFVRVREVDPRGVAQMKTHDLEQGQSCITVMNLRRGTRTDFNRPDKGLHWTEAFWRAQFEGAVIRARSIGDPKAVARWEWSEDQGKPGPFLLTPDGRRWPFFLDFRDMEAEWDVLTADEIEDLWGVPMPAARVAA